jgi:hypothetical protein
MQPRNRETPGSRRTRGGRTARALLPHWRLPPGIRTPLPSRVLVSRPINRTRISHSPNPPTRTQPQMTPIIFHYPLAHNSSLPINLHPLCSPAQMENSVNYASHLSREAHTINFKSPQTPICTHPNSTPIEINNFTNFKPTQTPASTSTPLMNWNRTPTVQLVTQPLELNSKTMALTTTPGPRNSSPPKNPRLLLTPCQNHTTLTPPDKGTIASTHNVTSIKNIK